MEINILHINLDNSILTDVRVCVNHTMSNMYGSLPNSINLIIEIRIVLFFTLCDITRSSVCCNLTFLMVLRKDLLFMLSISHGRGLVWTLACSSVVVPPGSDLHLLPFVSVQLSS